MTSIDPSLPPPIKHPPGPKTPWLVARSLVDLIPPVRLAWVLRIAAAPLWIATTATAMLVWEGLVQLIGGFGPVTISPDGAESFVPAGWFSPESAVAMSLGYHRLLANPAEWIVDAGPRTGVQVAVGVIGFVLWTPLVMALLRAGASLVAGGPLPSWRATWRLVRQRLGTGYLIVATPLLLLLIPYLLIIAIGRMGGSLLPVAALMMLVVVIIGLIARGAVPFALTALVTEAVPDAIDCLSRGTEALLRRLPLVAVSVALGVLILMGLNAMARLAVEMTGQMQATLIGHLEPDFWLIQILWHAWLATVAVAMLGGVYVIASCSATGREIDATWDVPGPAALDLPSCAGNPDSYPGRE